MIKINEPTIAQLHGYEDQYRNLKQLLTYTDKTAVFEYNRFKKAYWYLNKHGPVAYEEEKQRLKDLQEKCLLNIHKDGYLYTYSGLVPLILKNYNDTVENNVVYPKLNPLNYFRPPEYDLRYYQEESVEKLLSVKHGAIEISTGCGKTAIIAELIKRTGLKTLVVAPTKSIAEQIYDVLEQRFGYSKVGFFGSGKKKYQKLITVGIDESLTRIKEGSAEWEELSKCQMVVFDEAHVLACDTVKHIALGVARAAPYRFFVSATQMRNDGADMLLDGLIGPVVYEYGSKQAIEEGFLAKPTFFMQKVLSGSNYQSDDALRMIKEHFYNNKEMHKMAALTANNSVQHLDNQVLILIDQVEQFQHLLPYLRYEVGFAHGGVTKANKQFIDSRFHKSNPKELVKKFNEGKLPILVGTGCISIGTDIPPVDHIIMLQSGKSEIKFKQAIGRGTRKTATKNSFLVTDFMTERPYLLKNHALERIKIYKDVWDDVKIIN